MLVNSNDDIKTIVAFSSGVISSILYHVSIYTLFVKTALGRTWHSHRGLERFTGPGILQGDNSLSPSPQETGMWGQNPTSSAIKCTHTHTVTRSSSLSLSFDVMRDTCSCIVNPYTHNHTITCICLIVHINLYRSSLFLFCIWVGNVLVGWLSFFKNGWVLCTCILKFQFKS